jgi:acetylornithine deacetylase
MKCGLASIVYATEALKNCGVRLKGDLILESVIEEEATGNGALACFVRGYTADAALIAESNGPMLMTVQAGSLWLRITVYGSAGHAEGAIPSVNAIEKAYDVMRFVKEIEADCNAHAHPVYDGIEHPLHFVVGTIQGGCWPSSTPAKCEFTVRIGLNPDADPAALQDDIAKQLLAKCNADSWLATKPPVLNWYGHRHSGLILDPQEAFFRVLADAHEAFYHEKIALFRSAAFCDMLFFNHRGVPCTCYGAKGYNFHGDDEYVDIPSVRNATKVIASLILRWCETDSSVNRQPDEKEG